MNNSPALNREPYLLYMVCKQNFNDLILLNCQVNCQNDVPDAVKLRGIMKERIQSIVESYIGYWTLSTTPDDIRAWMHSPDVPATHFLYQETFSHILAHVRKVTPIEDRYTHHRNPTLLMEIFEGVHNILINALHLLMRPHNTKRATVAVPLKREWSEDSESKSGWIDGDWEYALPVPFEFDEADKEIIVTKEDKHFHPIEGYFIKKVEWGSPLAHGNQAFTLTMKEILGICSFVGISYDMSEWDGTYPNSDADSLEREYTIDTYTSIADDDKILTYGTTIHDSEYPEEGFMMIDLMATPWDKDKGNETL